MAFDFPNSPTQDQIFTPVGGPQYRWDGQAWQKVPTYGGPAGPQGPAGPTGPAGADGAQGPAGPPGELTQAAADMRYVNVTGDTMTGALGLTYPAPADGSKWNEIAGYCGTNKRWSIYPADGGTETGGNAGSDLVIERYADNGASLGAALGIYRATGVVNFATAPTVNGIPMVGGATLSDTPPASPATGQFWLETDTGALFVRWADANSSQWVQVNPSLDVSGLVKKTGDTMSGDLTISKANPVVYLNKTGTAQDAPIYWQQGGLSRWAINNDGSGETGSNVGSNFVINRFNDAGAYIDTPLSINRATGMVIGKGIVRGASFHSQAPTIADIPAIALVNEGGTGVGAFAWSRVNNRLEIQAYTGGYVLGIYTTNGQVCLGTGFASRQGEAGTYLANKYNLAWISNATQCWIDTYNSGNITVTSDYRVKKDVEDLPSMWDQVKALRPIRYTHTDFTPPSSPEMAAKIVTPTPGPLFTSDDIEQWGFIAHEAQETLVAAAASGEKDMVDGIQALNWAPIVAALTKALQEAMARIEALEAR